MTKRRATITPTGMNRDLSKSKFNPEFVFDARNIRVSARDQATRIASVTNERGPLRLNQLIGNPVGTFTADAFLGVFSFDETNDYITVYQKRKDQYTLYYQWQGQGLGFSELWDPQRQRPSRLIETEVSTEASNSTRVYWVDGVHPPRVIDFKRRHEIVGTSVDNITSDYFLFLPKITQLSQATATKRPNGYFYSGTVQFCVTEVINANESNIVHYSPLHYCSPVGTNRASSPENVTEGCSFKFEWWCDDPSLIDFFIVYAIYRSSEDGSPVVLKEEVKAYDSKKTYEVTFVGNEETEDSAHLTFKNTAQFTSVATIAQQDGTLFLGNLSYSKETETDRSTSFDVTTELDREITDGTFNASAGYTHTSQLDLDSFKIGHFKRGERYALGYQIMDEYGHWGEPFYLDELKTMDVPPKSDGTKLTIPSFKSTIGDLPKWAKAIRPVVAYMDDSQKHCLHQGIVTPTIFCEKDRAEGVCYAKYSPFARSMRYIKDYTPFQQQVNPNSAIANSTLGDISIGFQTKLRDWVKPYRFYTDFAVRQMPNDKDTEYQLYALLGYGQAYTNDKEYDSKNGTLPANQHLQALGTNKDYNGEFQTSWTTTDVVYKSALIPYSSTGIEKSDDVADDAEDDREDESQNLLDPEGKGNQGDLFTIDNTKHYVDTSVLTLHSPDVSSYTSVNKENGKIEIVGAVTMDGFKSDTNIVASVPVLPANDAFQGTPGFTHMQLSGEGTGARCAMTLPLWQSCWAQDDKAHTHAWAVSPFSGEYLALENDFGTKTEHTTSKLEYKQLSNFRYSKKTLYYESRDVNESDAIVKTCTDRGDLQKFDVDNKLYKPSEDTVLVPNSRYTWSNGFYYTGANKQLKDWLTKASDKLRLAKVNKVFIEDRNNLLNCFACIENTDMVKDLMSFNFVPFSTVTCRDYYRKSQKPSYRGFWRGKVKNLGFSWSSETEATKNTQQWYSDRFHVLFNDSKHGCLAGRLTDGLSDYSNGGEFDRDDVPLSVNVSLKYLSTPHMMIALDGPIANTNYLSDYISKLDANRIDPVKWNSTKVTVNKYDRLREEGKPLPENYEGDALWLVDLINNSSEPDFDPKTAQWLIAGEAVPITNGEAQIRWVQGDWFFQRWECLRTYAETPQDQNQVTEIISFCVETRTNIDGRYDRNRGTAKLTANPSNWNLINQSYTQKNNFFTYSVRSENDNVIADFPVSITWSLPKRLNANVDTWTNITSVSMLDFDGDKGPITRIIRNRNLLFCFQPSGISQIMFNSRTQLATNEGMPIEIANSGKVDGKTYISNASGAVNNYNIVSTDNALYYVDAYNKCFAALNEQRGQISEALGFHSYLFSLNEPDKLWSMIDSHNSSVMLIDEDALSYNEKHTCFESFYDYAGTASIANIEDDTLLLHKDDSTSEDAYYLWRINAGRYNKFFGIDKRYYLDCLISGPAQTDKVFNNVEYRGDIMTDDGDTLQTKKSPFNVIQAYHEYQDSGEVKMDYKQYSVSNIKNMFRSWDCFIPRNKFRKLGRIAERIRNPWAHIKMIFDPDQEKPNDRNKQAVIQDINVDYFE